MTRACFLSAPLAGLQKRAVVEEAGKVHGNQADDEALAAAPSDHEPCFVEWRARHVRAQRAFTIEAPLLWRHGEAEQRGQEREPRGPVLFALEPPSEKLRVADSV
jgi:hypothetical protein